MLIVAVLDGKFTAQLAHTFINFNWMLQAQISMVFFLIPLFIFPTYSGISPLLASQWPFARSFQYDGPIQRLFPPLDAQICLNFLCHFILFGHRRCCPNFGPLLGNGSKRTGQSI